MKLSFSTLGCPDWSLETIAEKAREYGFDGVELRARGRQHIDTDMSYNERRGIKRLFEANGVEICCIAGYSKFCTLDEKELETNRELLEDYINLASEIGAPVVRTFIGKIAEGVPEEEVAKRAAYHLNLAGKRAEESGVTIVVETHDQFSAGAKVGKLLDMIGSRGVAALWDIHHPYNSGETVQQTYEYLGDRIRHVHLKDAAGDGTPNGKLCLTGRGILPIKEMVTLLESKGYSGFYSLEWEKMWHKELEEPEIAFPAYLEYMKKI